MKNNRKIEVGQVRKVNDKNHHRFGEMYYISRIEGTTVLGKSLTGKYKGVGFEWYIAAVEEDIVVM